MHIQGEGVILKIKPQSRGSFWVCLFSQEYGKISGLVTGGSKKLADLEQGNIVEFEHTRRLESQLGSMKIDVLKIPSSVVFHSAVRMQVLQYLCDLLHKSMQELEPHPNLYHETKAFLTQLAEKGLWERLGWFELKLLGSIGYGLSLEEGLAVRAHENDNSPLVYVSPKSGRAVSQQLGTPYAAKILPLPALFGGKSKDFLDVFNLTGHFLQVALDGETLPSRSYLIQNAQQTGFKDE